MSAKASLLIHASVEEVYRSFLEPERLTQFWLAAASAHLEIGKTVQWDFMVPGASVQSRAEVLEPGQRILIHWDESQVEWTFIAGDGYTVVSVEHRNLPAKEIVPSTEGFTTVLCDLKLLLETGKSPGLVRDKALLIQKNSAAPGSPSPH